MRTWRALCTCTTSFWAAAAAAAAGKEREACGISASATGRRRPGRTRTSGTPCTGSDSAACGTRSPSVRIYRGRWNNRPRFRRRRLLRLLFSTTIFNTCNPEAALDSNVSIFKYSNIQRLKRINVFHLAAIPCPNQTCWRLSTDLPGSSSFFDIFLLAWLGKYLPGIYDRLEGILKNLQEFDLLLVSFFPFFFFATCPWSQDLNFFFTPCPIY